MATPRRSNDGNGMKNGNATGEPSHIAESKGRPGSINEHSVIMTEITFFEKIPQL